MRSTLTATVTGVAVIALAAAATGCGSSSSGGSGSAGSSSTRARTLEGTAVACRIDIRPPMEFPTRITGVPTTSRMNRSLSGACPCSSRW